MDIAVQIAIVIVCLAVSVLCVYIMVAIQRSRETLERVERSLESVDKALVELNERLAPVLEDTRIISAKLRTLAENVSENWTSLKTAAQIAESVMRDIQSFEKNILHSLNNPISIISTYGVAAVKGIRAFIATMRNDP